MMNTKTKEEIEILRKGGRILAQIMEKIKSEVRAGITTKKLDEIAEREIVFAGGRPSFKNYKPSGFDSPFPASLCVSINEEIVHGIPSSRVIEEGDLVSLDVGMQYRGLFTDMAVTIVVGEADENSKKFLVIGEGALMSGISQIRAGARLGDVGFAIQSFAEKEGFEVIRKLVGHGVGYAVHEDPEVPNWGRPGKGEMLQEGMVIAIEPMLAEGSYDIKLMPDGWTWSTKDCSRVVHFEHTVVVTKDGAEILTS